MTQSSSKFKENLLLFSIITNIIFLVGTIYVVNKIGLSSISNRLLGPTTTTEVKKVFTVNQDKDFIKSSLGRGLTMDIQGESLILVSTIPGKLCFDTLVKGSVIIRNTYNRFDKNARIYLEGVDYNVDYDKGEISRTLMSSIPDYSNSAFYNQKDFDHNKIADSSNKSFFIWIDYVTKNGEQLAESSDYSKYLVNLREKLINGIPVNIVSYGDSITAGGEASTTEQTFQYLYGNYLKGIFPKSHITIEDVSIPGANSSTAIAARDKTLGKTTPDVVLLGWGMNDHNIGGNSPEKFKLNLMTLVDKIKSEKNAEVIIFSTFPPNDEWHYGTHSMNQYAEATKKAAIETNCAYVDVYNTWIKVLKRKDISSLLGNNINHPNDFGHWLYFQSFKAMCF